MVFLYLWWLKLLLRNKKEKKVVYQILREDTKDPLFTIKLNKKDELILSISDDIGAEFSTAPIKPKIFAADYKGREKPKECERAGLIVVNITNINNELEVILSFDDEKRIVRASGDFKIKHKSVQSIGSNFDGTNPATFTMGELAIFERSLTNDEINKMRKYFFNKWKVGTL